MSGVGVTVLVVVPVALVCAFWTLCSYYNVRRKRARRDEIKDRLEGLYTGRIVRARESGAPIRPGSPAAPIATRDSGDRDSDKDSAYAASQAAMGAQIRTVEEAREFAADAARYDAAIRATARARGHGAERAAVDGADADPEDVVVLDSAETAGGSRRAPTRSRSTV
mmetsp:Transcript_14573/g.61543  ORF Transcript_14573/g.61543 Transcript_14573/m.61543 type:complete len:167 (+) Transcript_14573:1512-2012(+)